MNGPLTLSSMGPDLVIIWTIMPVCVALMLTFMWRQRRRGGKEPSRRDIALVFLSWLASLGSFLSILAVMHHLDRAGFVSSELAWTAIGMAFACLVGSSFFVSRGEKLLRFDRE